MTSCKVTEKAQMDWAEKEERNWKNLPYLEDSAAPLKDTQLS